MFPSTRKFNLQSALNSLRLPLVSKIEFLPFCISAKRKMNDHQLGAIEANRQAKFSQVPVVKPPGFLPWILKKAGKLSLSDGFHLSPENLSSEKVYKMQFLSEVPERHSNI